MTEPQPKLNNVFRRLATLARTCRGSQNACRGVILMVNRNF